MPFLQPPAKAHPAKRRPPGCRPAEIPYTRPRDTVPLCAMNTSPVPDVYARLRRTGVVAVLVLDDADNAVPLARALLAGGVDCMELTLRTPAALGRRSFGRRPRAAEGVRSSTSEPGEAALGGRACA